MIQKVIYIAFDGKEFNSASDCVQYEHNLKTEQSTKRQEMIDTAIRYLTMVRETKDFKINVSMDIPPGFREPMKYTVEIIKPQLNCSWLNND